MTPPLRILLAAGAALAVPLTASAGPTDFYELFASDAQAGDGLGFSVALFSTTLVAGAPGEDQFGLNAGAAYVFNVSIPAELGKLTAFDGQAGDNFGASVSVNGAWILVGADREDGNADANVDAGAAYVFNRATLMPAFKVMPADLAPGDGFGYAVATDRSNPSFGVVGAPYDDGPNNFRAQSGAAYLVNLDFGSAPAVYRATDAFTGDLFGASVGISGTRVAVGAPFVGGSSTGAVYLFERSGVMGEAPRQLAKITPPTFAFGEQFGMSVALEGNTLAVGAPGNPFNGIFSGAVYLYDITGCDADECIPTLIDIIRPEDPGAFDFFGESVDLSLAGDRLIVGAPFDTDAGSESGSAYVFELSSGVQISKLLGCSGRNADNFGLSVAIENSLAVAGLQGDDFVANNAGAVGVYPGAAAGFDCDSNGQPDSCEIADNPGLDCDNNGELDVCQIDADPSLDCDRNLRIDDCEIAADPDLDCWPIPGGNGILDVCDITADRTLDCDGNGIVDECEILANPALDCDNNGVLDRCDILGDPSLDCDDNGQIDVCEIATDPARDCFPLPGGDGILDACQIAADPSLDCDGNGVVDQCEITDPGVDCDGNGQIDACEIDANPLLDCDGNGVLDACQVAADPSLDCNGNKRLDSCDIAINPAVFDCDSNGVVDSCQINAAGGVNGTGGMLDMNFNSILDTCEAPPCPPDIAAPFGVLDNSDILTFITAFIIQDPLGDYNGDGIWDGADIAAYVADFNAGCP